MKNYLYLSNFTIYTQKTPEEVRAILQEQTTACKMGYWPSDEGAFIGEIGTSDFRVVPRPTWLQPRGIHAVLEGSIRTEADETVVDVKMRLPWGVYLIVPHFFVFAMGFLVWDWKGPYTMYFFKMAFLSVGGIGLLYWVCVRCWFHFGAKRAREDMEYLLED